MQSVFLGEHRLDPEPAIGRDRCHDVLECRVGKALAREDLANLLALALGHLLDVTFLLAAYRGHELVVRLDRLVVADGHAEAVGEQIGDAENQRDMRRETGADRARDDGERGDAAVDGAEHGVRHDLRAAAVLQPCGYCSGLVLAEQVGERGVWHRRGSREKGCS